VVLFGRRSVALVLTALGVLVFDAGVAAAKVTTGPGGALHGCVSGKGVLTVVKFTGACRHGETSIEFGVQGPAGAKGATGSAGATGGQGPAGPPADTSEITSLQSQVTTLTSEVSALQSTLAGVTRSGNTLLLSGLNMQLESGVGSTTGSPNGLGNLIIGYNESPGTQTGSGNLLLGTGQSFTSYGGIVAGNANTISGPFASVTGGSKNTARGVYSSISGGDANLASDPYATIAGGCANLAGAGTQPSDGSEKCPFSAGAEAMLGGDSNHALGTFAVAVGGCDNVAGTGVTPVLTGTCNDNDGVQAVFGGTLNTASSAETSVSGGSGNTEETECQAIPAAPVKAGC
jgi:hypothetical protein